MTWISPRDIKAKTATGLIRALHKQARRFGEGTSERCRWSDMAWAASEVRRLEALKDTKP